MRQDESRAKEDRLDVNEVQKCKDVLQHMHEWDYLLTKKGR